MDEQIMDDDMMDFFDFSKDFKRKELPRGCLTGDPNALVTEMHDSKLVKRVVIGTEYIAECVEKEKFLMSNLSDKKCSAVKKNCTMDDIDSDEEAEGPILALDHAFYEKYPFNLNRNKSLPIYAHREEIMEAINDHPVVIIKGETGCGKTTQVPQYILDEASKRGEYCNIVVTQPRRIAAISIANRVSQERKWQPGTVCAYQVGLHRQMSLGDTRLLYCTTGVLLNHLINQKTLTHYTHIVLDEVHERDQDMDFLLIVVRRLLAENSQHVKVILMSATIEAREFANYFARGSKLPPVINASHGRKYPLVKFYRDELKNLQREHESEQLEPGISPECYASAIKILMVIDNMERKAEEQSQVTSYEEALRTGSVLIFLPGINEIDNMAECITTVVRGNPQVLISIVRCHSLMTPDAQEDVFRPPPVGHRKVILTTNIAESSITVPDVSYVIDFCLTKVLVTDTATNFSTLRLVWASKANCRQRAGRVGRIRSGRVYRLVSKDFYKHCLSEFGVPEMLRSPLQNSVLKAKQLNMGRPSDILALALSPPNLSDIRNTVLLLKEVGALFTTVDGVYDELDGDITYWGIIMSQLPLDARLSRLIILGYIFNCLEETIVMAAGMSVRSLYFQSARGRHFDALWMNYTWADGSGSDLVAAWRLYMTYVNMVVSRPVVDSAEQWARRYHVNLRSLKEMHLLVQDLRLRCQRLNLQPPSFDITKPWTESEKSIIIKIVIAGAFYPNYFMRNNKANMDKERHMYQVISGHDPCNTVFFTNFEPRYMGELYTRRIKEIFMEARIPPEHIHVTFQHGSEKVFVTFKHEDDDPHAEAITKTYMPGRVMVEVYKAMCMRLNSVYRYLCVMDNFSAMKFVEQRKIGDVIEGRWVPPTQTFNVDLVILPSLYDKTIKGLITHIVSCDRFFFQPQYLAERIANMTEMFNDPQQLIKGEVSNASAITKGLLLLAFRRGSFQRARVRQAEAQRQNNIPKFRVQFIDYGDFALLRLDQLRLMPPMMAREFENLPSRMFECRLAMVQPSTMTSFYNLWPKDANDMLHSLASHGCVELEIYSLVNNVASVLIHIGQGILNDKLVERGWARRADEDFMSRQDHDFRLRKQEGSKYLPLSERRQINEEYLRSIQQPVDADLEPPPLEKCKNPIKLKGPYSPLETSIYSTLHVGIWKTVHIDRESVNSVLLDTDPQDQHDQLMVAASVAESGNGQALTARGTTLMPNIHGFGALMTMLFCRRMQIKCNQQRSKYVSLLAGLGYDPDTMESYYPEHDMVINLDVNILKGDITSINRMRYYIDAMFHNLADKELPAVSDTDRKVIFAEQRVLLTELLCKDRSFIEPHVSSADYLWESLPDLETVPDPFCMRSIFPMHDSQELRNESMDTLIALKKNLEQLYNWRTFDGVMQAMECKACNQRLENVGQLRLHLLTQLHRDREKQIGWDKQQRS